MEKRYIKIETGKASLWLQYVEDWGVLNAETHRYSPCTSDELLTMIRVMRKAGYVVSEIGGRD